MSVERMLLDLANDHHLALTYDVREGYWQVASIGPLNDVTATKHMLRGRVLKEVVRELYNDLKPGTVHAG